MATESRQYNTSEKEARKKGQIYIKDLKDVEDKISEGRGYGEMWTNREKRDVHTDYIVDGCRALITSKDGFPIEIRFFSEDINNLEKVLRELGLSPPRAA